MRLVAQTESMAFFPFRHPSGLRVRTGDVAKQNERTANMAKQMTIDDRRRIENQGRDPKKSRNLIAVLCCFCE